MNRFGQKGSITVFLSLTCILFLALICTLVESARIQGAKAQTANIMGMGNFSLLGEFEKELLERYEIFGLDGTYGGGTFQIQNVEARLENFLLMNTNPRESVLTGLCFDPWNLSLTGCEVEEYALLTDDKGEPFYQQAVAFMRENAGVIAVEELITYAKKVEEIKKNQKQYESSQKVNDGQMENLEVQRQQKLEELESEAEKNTEPGALVVVNPVEELENPLKEIAKLRKKSTLELVTWDKEISGKKMIFSKPPSKSRLKEGTLELKKEESGLVANVLFREYLMRYFPNYLERDEGTSMDYQVEYLIGGKKTDKENLNYVVSRLLLIREGMNYLYCNSNPQISSQANGLAASLTGFLGIPALTAATGQAIMLAWAYGESLIDVRILLDGGKVPLIKTAESWNLSLENLGKLTAVLERGAEGKDNGMSYQEYLRVLLHMGTLSNQKMRALDLIQAELQTRGNLGEFQVKNCIVAVKSSGKWNCGAVFLSVPAVTNGLKAGAVEFEQEGSIAY